MTDEEIIKLVEHHANKLNAEDRAKAVVLTSDGEKSVEYTVDQLLEQMRKGTEDGKDALEAYRIGFNWLGVKPL